jgi:hypothetical protein
MAPAVEEDVAARRADPGDAGLFRAAAGVFQAQGVAHLVQKPLGCWLWFQGRFPSFDGLRILPYTANGGVPPNNPQKNMPWRIMQKISVNAPF